MYSQSVICFVKQPVIAFSLSIGYYINTTFTHTVVQSALSSHQCGPVSIPRLGVTCRSNLLVLYSAPRGFSPGTPFFPFFKNQPTGLIWVDLIWFDLCTLSTNSYLSAKQSRQIKFIIMETLSVSALGLKKNALSLVEVHLAIKLQAVAKRLRRWIENSPLLLKTPLPVDKKSPKAPPSLPPPPIPLFQCWYP